MIDMPQNTTKSDRISQEELQKLIETRNAYCLSIFIPTSPHGEDVLQKRDAQGFDVQLRQIRKELESRSLTGAEIEGRLEPLEAVRNDSEFWREQSHGLAVFASGDWMRTFRLPLSFEPMHRISPSFYLMPLIPVMGDEGHFYLLSLELERIRLYRGTKESLQPISLKGRIPQRMEDRVGYDYEEKGLQFRSQHQAHEAAGYHGHAEANRDRKNEIKRFFREVNTGILPLLQKDPAPLVVASQEYLAAIYKEVNTYPELLEGSLQLNLSEASENDLLHQALRHLAPVFEQDYQHKWARFMEFNGTGRASSDMRLIFPAALEGRIDTLFVASGSQLWGNYDEQTGELVIDENPDAFSLSPLNQAVLNVLQNSGHVYVLKPEDLPEGSDPAFALFRY